MMITKLFFVLGLAVLMPRGAESDDKITMVGDINVKVSSTAGTLNVYRGDDEAAAVEKVTINLSCAKEATASAAIPTTDHTFTDLSGLEFTVSSEESDNSTGISASMLMATTNLTTDARTVTLKAYIFKEGGSAQFDGVSKDVEKGNVLLTVMVAKWAFCGDTGITCTDGGPLVATALDLCLTVTSAADPTQNSTDTTMYDIGSGLMMFLDNKYTATGEQTMPATYPMLNAKVVTLRFAKFADTAQDSSLIQIAASQETGASVSNIFTKVLGRSCKIRIASSEEAVKSAQNSITVDFDSIMEMKADGTSIKSNGHKYNSFASQDCEIGAVTDDTLQTFAVKKLAFNANLGNGATLTVTLYMFKVAGSITQGDETIDVEKGTTKFTVEVENWPFCSDTNSCEQGQNREVGAFLDFAIVIKGTGAASKDGSQGTNKGDKYKLGGGTVTFSKMLKMDDATTFVNMPADYPRYEMKGNKQTFTLRFPVFTSKVFYDPSIDVDSDGEGTTAPPTEAKEVEASGVKAKALGNSGKIEIMSASTGDANSNTIVVQFDKLQEMKQDGSAIQGNQHSVNTFANQAFTFGSVKDGVVQGIGASTVEFMSTLNNGATVKVMLSVFKADGTITQGDETTAVKKGNVKFSVEIMNWKFCGDVGATGCNNGDVGMYLDFVTEIKSKSGNASKLSDMSGKGKSFDLGDGNTLMMSKKINVDGSTSFTNMADTYPMLDQQGSKQLFKIRLPKFVTSVMYDPVMELGASGAGTVRASLLTLVCFVLAVLFKQ